MPTMMEEVRELRGKKNAAAEKQRDLLKAGGDDLANLNLTTDQVAEIRKLNDELDAIGTKLDPLEIDIAEIARAKKRADELAELDPHPGHPQPGKKGERKAPAFKSIGEDISTTDAFAKRVKGNSLAFDVSIKGIKTLMTTTAGIAPEITRSGLIVPMAQRPIQLFDVIPHVSTGQAGVRYLEETTYTNNAAEVAEAGTYPEGVLAMTERTSNVQKIGVSLPVTDEQFEDVPYAESYVNQRIPFMVMQRLDSQLANGNGTAPNLRGILNVVGLQTQPLGGDPGPDAIYKAMTLVRVVGRAVPGPVAINTLNWSPIRLLKTADGIYIWGSPSEAGPDRIWGQPIVLVDALPSGTAVVGDWANYSQLAERHAMMVKMTDSHSTFFVEGKLMIRADIRAAIVWLRPAAFCSITGLPV